MVRGDSNQGKEPVAKMEDTEVGKNIEFSDGREIHHLWMVVNGDDVDAMWASKHGQQALKKLGYFSVDLK